MAVRGRVLITGNKGQLGRDLAAVLAQEYAVSGFDIDTVDICDLSCVQACLQAQRPRIVLHTAAYTDVDGAESHPDAAMSVNAEGTRNVAVACQTVGARLIYYSTDYVFDGKKDEAYTEDDSPNPGTVYGRSKWLGEQAIGEVMTDAVIMRIAWVYGRHGKNFVRTMLKLGHDQLEAAARGEIVRPLKIVNDQVGNPTWTVEIARQTALILGSDLRGVVHATCEGEVSWYRFAEDIFECMNLPVLISACSTAEYPRPAPRPARSSLENTRLKQAGLNRMRPYRQALEEYLQPTNQ